MRKGCHAVILAEDQRQQRFVRKYLYRIGYHEHDIRPAPISAGRGSGEQRVRQSYASAVAAHRQRATYAQTTLIVIIDADNGDVLRRQRQLDQALRAWGLAPRGPDERIVHLIPKWSIETWILCLNGRAVDENVTYRHEVKTSMRKSCPQHPFSSNGPAPNGRHTPHIARPHCCWLARNFGASANLQSAYPAYKRSDAQNAAASGLCVIIRIVCPSRSLRSRITSSTAFEFSLSRFPVGSSASRIAGQIHDRTGDRHALLLAVPTARPAYDPAAARCLEASAPPRTRRRARASGCGPLYAAQWRCYHVEFGSRLNF